MTDLGKCSAHFGSQDRTRATPMMHTLASSHRCDRDCGSRLPVPCVAVLGPARLGRFSERFAALLGTDMAPPRRAQTDRRSMDRFRREFSAGEVQELEREIEEDLRRKTRVTHHASQPRGAARPEEARQLCGER